MKTQLPILQDYNADKGYLMTEDKADVWLWVIVIVGMGMFIWVLGEAI